MAIFQKYLLKNQNTFHLSPRLCFLNIFPNLYDYARNVQAAWSDFLKIQFKELVYNRYI